METFWSSAGWRDRPEDHITPDDRSYVRDHGLMFEPRRLAHDEAVAEAIAASTSP